MSNQQQPQPQQEESGFGIFGVIVAACICGVKLAVLLCVIFGAYIAAGIITALDLIFWAVSLAVILRDAGKPKNEPPPPPPENPFGEF